MPRLLVPEGEGPLDALAARLAVGRAGGRLLGGRRDAVAAGAVLRLQLLEHLGRATDVAGRRERPGPAR